MTSQKDSNTTIMADSPAGRTEPLLHNPFVIWMTNGHEVSLHGGWTQSPHGTITDDPNASGDSKTGTRAATTANPRQQAICQELHALMAIVAQAEPHRDGWQIMTIDITPAGHQPARRLSPGTIAPAIPQNPNRTAAMTWNSFADAARVAIEEHHQWQTTSRAETQSHTAISAITHDRCGNILQMTLVPPPLQTHAEPRAARLVLQNGRRQMTMHLPARPGRGAPHRPPGKASWSRNNIRHDQASPDAIQHPDQKVDALLDTLQKNLRKTQDALHRIMSYNRCEATKHAAIRHLGHMGLAAQYLEAWSSLQTGSHTIDQNWRLTNPTTEAIREWINSLEPKAPHHEMTVRMTEEGQLLVHLRPCSFPPMGSRKAATTHHLQRLQSLTQMMPELAQGIARILRKECGDHEHI